MIDYRRPFVAIRSDPRWKHKVLLGALISLIPYVGLVWLLGWQMQYQRNVAWGNDERLPEWSDFKNQALLGLYGLIAVLPYSFLISLVTVPLSAFGGLAMASVGNAGDVTPIAGPLAMYGATMLVTFASLFLVMPLSFSATLRVALYGTAESGLQFGEIFRLMRANRSNLNRAWRYGACNVGISLGVMALWFGASALVFVAAVSIDRPWAVASMLVFLPLSFVAYLLCGMALSVVLGVANSHYFAGYGRIAYGLDSVVAKA